MKTWIPSILSAILCTVLTTACSTQKNQAETDTQVKNPQENQQSKTITIGAVLPFSGGLEIYGEQAKAGIDLAIKEVNDAGGIDGQKLEVLYEDNKTDPKTAVEKTTKLIRKEKAIAILGPILSSARDAMTPTITNLKTPLLYATNYEGGVCEKYIYSFNTVPNQELEQLIPEMATNVGNSFYLFGTDYVWPQKMFERAEVEIAKVNGTVSGKAFTNWGTTDYTPAIRKIMASNAKVLVFAVPGVDGTTFIKQAQKLGLTKKMSIAFLGFSETYIPALGDTQDMDIWTTVPFISTMESSNTFVQNIKKETPDIIGVSHYARTHYNAVKALTSALEKSKDFTSNGVVAGLKSLKTDTIDINADNQANLTMFIGKIQNNQLQMVKKIGLQAADVGCIR